MRDAKGAPLGLLAGCVVTDGGCSGLCAVAVLPSYRLDRGIAAPCDEPRCMGRSLLSIAFRGL